MAEVHFTSHLKHFLPSLESGLRVDVASVAGAFESRDEGGSR
jgi:hypothetical protein